VSKLLDLPEPPGMVYNALAGSHLDWGRLPEALHWRKQGMRAHRGRVSWQLAELSIIYEQLNMPEAADDWAEQLVLHYGEQGDGGKQLKLALSMHRDQLEQSAVTPAWLQQQFDHPDSGGNEFEAKVLISAGRYRDGIDWLEGLVRMPETWGPEEFFGEQNFVNVHWLAYAYEQAGMDEKARSTLAWAARRREFMDSVEPFHDNPKLLIQHALHFAAVGELPRAATALRKAVDMGWRAYHLEKNNPVWRGAWQSQEFAPIVADILADLERQRREVEVAEADHDFGAEFEALIAGD
jgi:hypothetical protein